MTKDNRTNSWRKLLRSLRFGERGTAAVSFILCLPIFLCIVAVIVQLALLVNAKIVVNQAAAAAARAGMTSLPDERSQNVQRAARMSVTPISPMAKTPTTAEATAVDGALQGLGINPGANYAARYTYAETVTRATYNNVISNDFPHNPGQYIEVEVTYELMLNIPMAQRFIGRRTTVAGIEGWFYQVRSTAKVMTAHGRKTRADGQGWPR